MPFRHEAAIRERLTKKIQGVNGVFGAPPGAQFDSLFARAPCLYVIFSGADPVGENNHPGKSIIQVEWQVVVVVRNLEDTNDGAAARADAQALGQQVFSAMHGWRPPGMQRPFKFSGAPTPFFDSGRQLVALNFSITYPIGE